MDHAVIIDDGSGPQALIKCGYFDRAYAVMLLCKVHLGKARPGCLLMLSHDKKLNLRLAMHPDRDAIIHDLRALEFPLPTSKHVLEGEYTVVKKRRAKRPRPVQ